MPRPAYSLGLDYGTHTVRALIVRVHDGAEIGTGVEGYAHGDDGIISSSDPYLARQHPSDYKTSLVLAVRAAIDAAAIDAEFSPERVIGIGIDATASTPLPVDVEGRPLAERPEFQDDLAALAWLWKDHTSHAEAEEITTLAKKHYPEHLARCGGLCSSEWYFPKLLRLAREAPRVLDAADAWVELGDYVAGFLAGRSRPGDLPRNACAAGHKAMFHESQGLPRADFFAKMSPELGAWLESRLFARTLPSGECMGRLPESWAERLGLPAGLAVSPAAIDAHLGAVGAGIRPGMLVKILGTSSCDMLVHPAGGAEGAELLSIPGLSGVVRDSILPGHWGIEAGQAAVGDIYAWCVREFATPAGETHESLTEKASALAPGESGLLALDWNNGNRCLLGDPLLSGLLIGQRLDTSPHEIYRALIEATAFGARLIVDRIVESGVPVTELLFCGGIAEKNEFLLQVYADILERPIRLSRSSQTCALGAAMFGALAAGPETGGPRDLDEARRCMTGVQDRVYTPDASRSAIYSELRTLYALLHDAFSSRALSNRAFSKQGSHQGGPVDLSAVMKDLIRLASRARTQRAG